MNLTLNDFHSALQSERQSFESLNDLICSINSLSRSQTRSMTKSLHMRAVNEQPLVKLSPTPLSGLHVEGMTHQQIWTQLEMRTSRISDAINAVTRGVSIADHTTPGEADVEEEEEFENEEDMDDSDEGDADPEIWGNEDTDIAEEQEGREDQHSQSSHEDFVEGPERLDALRDASSDSSDHESSHRTTYSPLAKETARRQPHRELDDGFFKLSEFNAETEEAEARATSRGHLAEGSDEESLDEEEIDLFGSVDAPPNDFDEQDLERGDSGDQFSLRVTKR